ncbi:unnamed protein product [Timema podura]|uniref:Uncharacterized protein n=1 Tax=Timema podura TaxID=61482 RepID=A0ABN7NVY6_TIMPD|nr:unnamed protein product [Timema podura]
MKEELLKVSDEREDNHDNTIQIHLQGAGADVYETVICIFWTAEIIRERLPKEPSRDSLVWNTGPGALLTLPHFSDTWQNYPFYLNMLGNKPGEQFTAIIYSQLGSSTMNTAPLFRLVRNVAHSQYVARIMSVVPKLCAEKYSNIFNEMTAHVVLELDHGCVDVGLGRTFNGH